MDEEPRTAVRQPSTTPPSIRHQQQQQRTTSSSHHNNKGKQHHHSGTTIQASSGTPGHGPLPAVVSHSSGTSRKHGFSLGHSIRRLLNPTSYSRKATLNNTKRGSQVPFKDNYSENGSTGDAKSVSNVKATSFCATYSTMDFEAHSLSSARSELTTAQQQAIAAQQPEASGSRSYRPIIAGNSSGGGVDGSDRSRSQIECPLCLLELPPECFPQLATCSHRACVDCLQAYLRIEISESRVNIACPECSEAIHPNDIRMVLDDELFLTKYETFMLRRVLAAEPDSRWCPAPDCGYVVIAAGCASCPRLRCGRPGCETSFCYHCKQEWHPNQTCDAARAQRHQSNRYSPHARSSSVSFSHDSVANRDDIKPCPCCKVLIIKMDDGSCNHMTCGVCGTEFCWLCMKEISDLHYLSPSGCTFWGKKPWSRKKKIMWQLGMLVGAPVGIALIAGIAVPAIIIGIPVWVGRKLHSRLERQTVTKHRRNMLVTSGVLTSIFVSPILAGVAVGIGVPILLAYVYGVVPISLCRSGGCGVTTSPTGVRIEMDEEEGPNFTNNTAQDGLSVDTALSHKGVNPSIGEVSLGMSASPSMGSGAHLDKVGTDRESASNAALAGSIASATTTGCAGSHKLDFQSEVSSNKRFSVSSHSETASASVSLSERSANFSLADDMSTRALAGSIVSYRDVCIGTSTVPTTPGVTPVEVHISFDSSVADCGREQQIVTPCCFEDAVSVKSTNVNTSHRSGSCK